MTKAGRGGPTREGRVIQAAQFKARALEVMRAVRDTGKPITVTSHGRPLVNISPPRQ
jgi:prevent-host-death family protein